MLLFSERWCFYSSIIKYILLSSIIFYGHCQFDCDFRDPNCHNFHRQIFNSRHSDNRFGTHRCNSQSIWLIPGRADDLCTKYDTKKIFEIDTRHVKIRPEIIRIPGCFTVEIMNVKLLENDNKMPDSYFGKVEYQWINNKAFSELKCQNASSNGCGGIGNNCYYCDICESLKKLNESNNETSSINQLKGLMCPDRPGYYTFRKEFCFNDWSVFDKNGDCQFDFLQEARSSDYKAAFSSLQQIGFGTIVAKIRLAYNATDDIYKKRTVEEQKIKEAVLKELNDKRQTWDVSNTDFQRFQQWYINYQTNLWHKKDYLPWLLHENEVACIRLTFDVCERRPSLSRYGKLRYTCDTN